MESDYVDRLRSISIQLKRVRRGLELAGNNMLAGSTGVLSLCEGDTVFYLMNPDSTESPFLFARVFGKEGSDYILRPLEGPTGVEAKTTVRKAHSNLYSYCNTAFTVQTTTV